MVYSFGLNSQHNKKLEFALEPAREGVRERSELASPAVSANFEKVFKLIAFILGSLKEQKPP